MDDKQKTTDLSADGMAEVQVLKDKPSKKKRFTVITLVILLAAGGCATAWLLTHKDKEVSKKSTSNSSKTAEQVKAIDTVYLNVRHEDGKVDIRSLNFVNKSVKNISSAKTSFDSNYVILPDGTVRSFVFSDTSDGKGNDNVSFSFQDGSKEPKVVSTELAVSSDGKVSKTFWPGGIDSSGTKAYFYEANNLNGNIRIASVDLNGKVEELVSGVNYTFDTGLNIKGNLTPDAVSADGKTLYLQNHSCLNCDGPAHPNLVSFNIPTKTFKLEFSDPTGGGANTYGDWEKISDHYIMIRADTGSNLGEENYEEAIAARHLLYLFDTRTSKSVKVFESSDPDRLALSLQMSADEKAFYYFTNRIIKTDKQQNQGDGVHYSFEMATNEVRAFDIASSKTKTIDFGLDGEKTQPIFLSSNDDTYILGVTQRGKIFDDDAYPLAPELVYTAKKDSPKKIEKIYETESEKYLSLSWGGFAQ